MLRQHRQQSWQLDTRLAIAASCAAAALALTIAVPPFPVSAAGPDACTLFTAADVKATLGLEAAEAVAKPSFTGGTTCEYKGSKSGPIWTATLQLGDAKYAIPASGFRKGQPTKGIGDSGVWDPNNIQVVAGKKLVFFNLTIGPGRTEAQWSAAAKLILSRWN